MIFSRISSTLLVLFLTAVCASAVAQSATPPTDDPLHAWIAGTSPAALDTWVNQRLADEAADVARLLAATGPRTVDNTLRPFDDAQNQLSVAGNNAYLMFSLADAAPLRDKGQALEATISSASTDLSLNQQVYRALATIRRPATIWSGHCSSTGFPAWTRTMPHGPGFARCKTRSPRCRSRLDAMWPMER